MYYYWLYGLKMCADIEFPQLVSWDCYVKKMGNKSCPEIYVQAATLPVEMKNRTDRKWEFGETLSWLSNRTTWLLVENGDKISYELTGGGQPQYLQTYILGYGMSMLALQRGELAVHCSAVADDKGVLLIAGESGAGKSTLTTAFLEQGYRLLADDMALVETREDQKTYAYPGFPYQKLCRNVVVEKGYDLEKLIYIDEDKDKFLVPYEEGFTMEALPVKGFLLLGVLDGEEIVEEKAEGIQAFYVIANNLFLRHLLREEKFAPRNGALYLKMAANVPVVMLGRPKEKDTTKEIIEKAFRIVEELG